LSELLPPPLLKPVEVGTTNGVGLERIKITVTVAVGVGVSVLRGVGVNVAVGVELGLAATVSVDAAFTVSAINVLTAPGSRGGIGVEREGTAHANIVLKATSQMSSFVLRVDIFPLAHPKRRPITYHYQRSESFIPFHDIAFRIFPR